MIQSVLPKPEEAPTVPLWPIAGQSVLPKPEEAPTVPLWPIAGQAVGLGRSATFAAYHRSALPFPVLRCGGKLRVPTAALRRVLELDEPSVKVEGCERPD